MEKKTTKKATKPAVKKEVKKPIKVELNDKLLEMASFIEKAVKDERGKQLNTSACARLNKVHKDLLFISRNIVK